MATATGEAAYLVAAADGKGGLPTIPYELFFWKNPKFTGPVPTEQENAKQQLEEFGSRMRQTLAGGPDIDQYFQKLVITAQGTFNAAGFNPSAVNQIALYKQEIVQKVGSSIFAAYLRKLGLCHGMAIVVILCATFGLDRLVKSGIQSGAVAKVSAATANEDTKNGKKLGPVSVYESPGVLRWDATFSIVHTGILVASGLVGLFFAGCARAMDITFERLLVPNEDLLAPWIRLFLFGIPILVL